MAPCQGVDLEDIVTEASASSAEDLWDPLDLEDTVQDAGVMVLCDAAAGAASAVGLGEAEGKALSDWDQISAEG